MMLRLAEGGFYEKVYMHISVGSINNNSAERVNNVLLS
jgi:hypothetical protein